jgi:hypothetical protein
MECGTIFDLLNALSYVVPRRGSRWEAFAYKDCSHAFQSMPSVAMIPVSGTFTFTCTFTSA